MQTRISEGAVLELIDLAYAAAEQPSAWEAFLLRLASVLGGAGTAIVYDEFPGKATFASAVNLDPACMAEYETYYASRNAWASALRSVTTEGAVLRGEDYLPDAELVRTEYYNDVLRQIDVRHVIGAIPQFSGKTVSQVSILRSGRAGAFGKEEVRVLETVTPHLRRALRLHQRLVDLDIQRQSTALALDALATGVILLDSNARIIFMNEAARGVLAEHKGLVYERGEFLAANAMLTGALRALIRGAVATVPLVSSNRGGALALPRPDGRQSLEVRVSPIRVPQMDLGREHVAAVVFVVDPEHRAQADPAILIKLYAFTPAEARLACFLATGVGIGSAATTLGVSTNTVRTQLHSLFRKTGTNRQAELVALIGRGLAMGRRE